MISQNLCRLQIEKGAISTTSFAGIPLLTELAHHTGLISRLNQIPDLWERHGQYSTSDYIIRLVMTLIAGGEGLDDTRILKNDPGLSQLVFPDFPAPNSFGRILKRFTNRALYRLGEAVSDQAAKNTGDFKTLTLDIDASLIESDKELAKRTYKGFAGYNPVLAWVAEPDVFLGGVFRDGNASPQCHLTSLLRYCLKHLPKGINLQLRADSAAYRADLIEQCQRANVRFTICADLDPAVREAIEQIPQNAWQLVVKDDQSFLLAETVHVIGHKHRHEKLAACRLIVKKYVSGQLELFEDPIKYHAIITDHPESWTPKNVLEHYDARGTAEKMIGELKQGYGLDKMPCGDIKANAAFFQTCLLAYNLVQTFKRFGLPPEWKTLCIKNLRFRLLRQAAIVVRHARRLILKLPEVFVFHSEFQNARWAVMSPRLAT